VQEEQQRAAADEVEDDERRQRAERVHVVGAREAAAPSQRLPDAAPLEQRNGNREPGKREPRERGQDEDPDEEADRQEDDDTDREGGHERPPRGTCPGRE
jgi:hypothetical protein